MALTWIPAVAALALTGFSSAPAGSASVQMTRLDQLVGKWEGSGWLMLGPNDRLEVKGTIEVSKKMGGHAFVFEEVFNEGDTDRVAVRALGLITYRESKSSVMAHMVYSNRPEGDYVFDVSEKGFTWKLELEHGATVTYKMVLESDGTWHETAGYAFQGSDEVNVMDLKLKKVE